MAQGPTDTDKLMAESERLRRWLASLSQELGTYVDRLAEQTRGYREGEDDCGDRADQDG